MPTRQENMIGVHPSKGIFGSWVSCTDTTCTPTKIHRALEEVIWNNSVNDQVSKWIIDHHLSLGRKQRLNRKKAILAKHDFENYANQFEVFPSSRTTQKGNLAEIVLCEYLKESSGAKNLVYRLHFNPNVDQSMKGDDVLLVNSSSKYEIYLGESKYRKTSSKAAVDSVSKGFKTAITLPISLTFIADRLSEVGNFTLADEIYDLHDNLYKNRSKIMNIGFIMSDSNVCNRVETHMNSANPNFIIVSMALNNTESIITDSYEKAKKMISGDVYGL